MHSPARLISVLSFSIIGLVWPFESEGQYAQVAHRIPSAGEIPVTAEGSYDIPGTTYVLMNDITSQKSAVFLGKDITLDLNGFTITYANGDYDHIPNGSFEEGFNNWDLSKAPGAKIEGKKVHVFIGNNILRLNAGEEISSSYITLPVALRSYIAFCGVIGPDMRISVFVEDRSGRNVKCITAYGDSTMISCPILNRSPRLGGGFIFAHLNG
jgi:hypothetical protein